MKKKMEAKLARWWKYGNNNKIVCTLCPRYCTIGVGQKGFCFIRENIGGKLYSTGYGRPTGFALDPIEKKPLNHFYPGTKALSFGTAGCNLGCKFCQNWHISKARLNETNALFASPEDVVRIAQKYNAESIAYTYNDPTIFGEYVIDVSRIARSQGIKNVMVTAGYITENAREEVYQYIDAANVDLKAFREEFYFKLTFSHLKPVLDTLLWLKKRTNVWIEITTLIIPYENDSDEEIKNLSGWIVENLGENVPLHFTAFHPDFKLRERPATPHSTLLKAKKIARAEGLNFVYLGNVFDSKNQATYCPNCGKELIRRNWHSIEFNLISRGKCPECGNEIAGCFADY